MFTAEDRRRIRNLEQLVQSLLDGLEISEKLVSIETKILEIAESLKGGVSTEQINAVAKNIRDQTDTLTAAKEQIESGIQ